MSRIDQARRLAKEQEARDGASPHQSEVPIAMGPVAVEDEPTEGSAESNREPLFGHDASELGSSAPLDTASLAMEAYPDEAPERRPPTPPLPLVPKVARPAAPPVPEVERSRPEGERTKSDTTTSVLDRVIGDLPQKVVVDGNIPPMSREQYRRLAASLHHTQTATGLKVVMIASAVQGEGKTLTSTNLALTFSESYRRRVLLIDADLRRPSLHTIFGVDNSSGLSEGLMSRTHRKLPVRQASERLAIIPAGRPSADPMAGLTSIKMRQVIDEAREAFDWVIIDTPPVVLLPDANLLGSMVDGAVLVVKAEATAFDMVNRAIAALGRERLLGVVLNRAQEQPDSGYGYYNYYATAPETAQP